GNNNVDSAIHFLGSINKAPVYFKVRNTWAGQLDSGKATSFGYKAGEKATGTYNTAFGTEALSAPSDQERNSAFGFRAAKDNRSGEHITAVGAFSLYNNISGSDNTAIGSQAMALNISGYNNTAVGRNALYASDTGTDNTAVGYLALQFNKSNNNTALGSAALYGNTAGIGNTAIGRASLYQNSIGSENVAVGNYSLQNNTIFGGNTAIGHRALNKNLVEGNTALGHDAAKENTSGEGITAIGFDALIANTTGNQNTAVGWNAGNIISTGSGNTFLGYGANANVGTRNNANAIGSRAFANCNNCMVLGSVAGVNGASSSVKVGIGTTTPFRDLTINSNVFGGPIIGFEVNDTEKATVQFEPNSEEWRFENQADGRMIFRTGNTQLKLSALGTVTIGPSGMVGPYTLLVSDSDKDPMIQFQKGATDKGFIQIVTDDIKIGTNASNDNGHFFVRTNGSDRMIVTNSGNVGVGTTSPAVRFQVGTNGDGSVARANAWQTFSDERFKTDIVSIDHALDKINRIGGYYYHWKNGEDQSRQAGLMAQEVEKVLPEVVKTDAEGYKSVDYGKMNALLIEAIKEQQKQIDELKNKLEKMNKAGIN
nr:tail fiber domain-containing protein [Chitinophagaceae bacterium]